ncbi:hypothetical protein EIP86_003092 [Pleurotus ostreatoroseus]|nr:hypothetical protein EIP86_003092 [Pleurotus ostreatoroseus]
MSSQLPVRVRTAATLAAARHVADPYAQVRRTLRATTRATVVNNKENATSRAVRASTRAKPPSTAADAKAAVTRVTASTAATRAKSAVPTSRAETTQGKRKREALGEVPRPPANIVRQEREHPGAKGKGKASKEAFDGVELKKPVSTTRAPAKAVASTRKTTVTTTTTTTTRRTRSVTAAQVKEEVAVEPPRAHHRVRERSQPARLTQVKEEPEPKDDDAMVIDPVPAPRGLSVRRQPPATAGARREALRRVQAAKEYERDEEEYRRAYKKQRTSSEAPDAELAEVEEVVQFQEVDPLGDDWDDLDAEDADDPLMVSEYVVDIFKYLKEVEQTTMPNPNYMEMQKDLAWKMRGILTDWLVQVHSRFRLLPETLFLSINIIDRFLSSRVVSLAKLQLVGITCMFIAAKVEEIVAPSANNFLYCADASYTEAEILQAERYVLKTLDWNLSYPNPIHFLRRVSKADEYNVQVRTVAKYLLEIQCLEWRLIAAPPSLMAAAAIWLARLILGFSDWTPNLAHYSSYSESEIIPTANLMLNYILKPVRHESFFRKYAGKKFMKSSIFCREWALSHWTEGRTVSLADELPGLKELIRIAREQEEREQAAVFYQHGV